MRKTFVVLVLLIFWQIHSYCQNFNWPSNLLKGYSKTLSGEKFNYHSIDPSITHSLLLRANNGFKPLEWETETVPSDFSANEAAFIWIYSIDASQATCSFELSFNNHSRLTFRNPSFSNLDPTYIKGENGIELSFLPLALDVSNDPMGFAILRVPASQLNKGKPQLLKISAEDRKSQVWYITFEAAVQDNVEIKQEPLILKQKEGPSMGIRLEILRVGPSQKINLNLGNSANKQLEIKPGYNSLVVAYPSVKQTTSIPIEILGLLEKPILHTLRLEPVKPWTIYLVQHTHTDVGYTRPQSEILPEHLRYIDYALDYCDKTDNYPDDARFRWTCETSWAVREYLKVRPPAQIERLLKRIREGRIEITGLFLNLSDLADETSLVSSLQAVRNFREAGIPVISAMQDDVNGLGWCLPDYLTGMGIKYVSMGENADRALRPFNKPTAFWWESPSGSRILAYRGEHYMWGNFMGVSREDGSGFGENLARELEKLQALDFPFDHVAVQFGGYFTDNSPPSTYASDLVKNWNEKYEYPHLRIATLKEFPQYIEKEHSADILVYRAAWPDWWTDGFGSAAIETAYARLNQAEIISTQALLSMAMLKGLKLPEHSMERLTAIRDAINFYTEHTFGAAESISDPRIENSIVQWGEKGSYVWEAFKAGRMLREDALGLLQSTISPLQDPSLLVFNTQGFTRDGLVEVFIDNQILSPDKPFRILDSEGNEMKAQLISKRSEGAYWAIEVKHIPAFGYQVLEIQSGVGTIASADLSEFSGSMENEFYKLTFDSLKNGIKSIYDKQLDLELIDQKSDLKLGEFIYERLGKNREQLSNFKLEEYTRTPWNKTEVRDFKNGPLWQSLVINGMSESCDNAAGIRCEIRLYKHEKKIELLYSMKKLPLTDPEGVYIAFPFQMKDGHLAFESQGGVIIPGKNQLEGTSSDWNGVQNFAAIRSDKGQVLLSSPEIPLMMLGGFNLGKFQRISRPESNHILSWVLNNYWTTNFRASQEGELKWNYSITSSSDSSNQFATAFGWGNRIPVAGRVIPAGNGKNTERKGSFLSLALGSVLLVSASPSSNGKEIILHFRESGGIDSDVDLNDWKINKRVNEFHEVNAIEEQQPGEINFLHFKPWQSRFIKLKLAE